MNLKSVLLILITALALVFYSCKKDKLEGDKSILIGEWEWAYTTKWVNYCDYPYGYYATLTPATENVAYSIVFHEKGMIRFYKNTELIWKCRIQVPYFGGDCTGSDNVSYSLEFLDGLSGDFYGCVGSDTISVKSDRYGFPFIDENNSQCNLYNSYFVRK